MSDRFNGESVFGPAAAEERSRRSCGIAFMAKASAPGRAKTRLVPPLTFDQAANLNTAFLQDVAENLVLADEQARRALTPSTSHARPPLSPVITDVAGRWAVVHQEYPVTPVKA